MGLLGGAVAQMFVVQGVLTRSVPLISTAAPVAFCIVHQNNILRTDNSGQQYSSMEV
jgi:hypothetical protein